MNWINRIRLIYRASAQRLFVSLLLLGMCIVSFYMIDANLEGHMNELYARRSLYNIFGVDTKSAGYIKCLNHNATREDADLLKEYLNSREDVIVTGYYLNQNTNDLIDGEYVTLFVSEAELVDLGALKLSSEVKQSITKKQDGCYQVLMGYNYRDKLQVGDRFTLWEQPCVVAGFLDKGATWPQRGKVVLSSKNPGSLDDMGILLVEDYKVFDNQGGRASELYFITKDGKNEEVAKAVKEYALSKKIAINVVNINDVIGEEIERNGYSAEGTLVAAVLLTVLAVVSVSASSVIMCLISRKQFGVMMICGVRQKDIMWMVVAQNALYYILGAIVAWIISRREVGPELVAGAGYMMLLIAGIGLVMLAISSVLPLIIIKKTPLIQMVHEK